MDRNTSAGNYGANMGWTCPVCGKTNSGSAKFCAGCGTPFQPYNTGYVSRDTGMYGNEFYAAPNNYAAAGTGRKSGALKIIALALGCIVLAIGIGFGVSHLLLDEDDDSNTSDKDNETEQVTEDEENNEVDSNAEPVKTEEPASNTENAAVSESGFVVGETYTVVSPQGVKVRSTPEVVSERGNQLMRSALPGEYYSQSQNGEYAAIDVGGKVKCLGMNGVWMKIMEGGWVCTSTGSETLVR